MFAVDEMQVKLSSLVGGNPEWHSQDPLTITFKKVSAAETLQALWDKVRSLLSATWHASHVLDVLCSWSC